MIVYPVRHAGRRQNIKSEILALGTVNIGVAVEPPQTNPARNVGNEAGSGFGEVVAEPKRDAVIKILRSANDRLDHESRVDLVITLKPAVPLDDAPPPARCEKLRGNLIAVGVANDSYEVGGLGCDFKVRRVDDIGRLESRRNLIGAPETGGRGGGQSQRKSNNAQKLHGKSGNDIARAFNCNLSDERSDVPGQSAGPA